MLNYLLIIRVYQITHSNTVVSGLVFIFLIPQLVFSIFAGIFVDRFDKKFVLISTNILRALILLPLFLIAKNVTLFFVVAFAIATITQFFIPAEAAMIPQAVRKRLLFLPANSLFAVTLYGSIIIGFIAAGPILKLLGITSAFFIIAILFLIAALFNFMMPDTAGIDFFAKQRQLFSKAMTYQRVLGVLFNDIGELIYTVLRSKKLIVSLLYLTISQAVILILGALMPGYAATVIGIDVEDSSIFLLAPAAIGMILGSFVVAHVNHNFAKKILVLPSLFLSGLLILLLPVFSKVAQKDVFYSVYAYLPFDPIILVAASCLLLGIFNAMIIVPSNTLLQEQSGATLRGRIYGLFNALSALLSLIPVLLAGYLSDLFGVGRVLTYAGIIIMIFALVTLVSKRKKR